MTTLILALAAAMQAAPASSAPIPLSPPIDPRGSRALPRVSLDSLVTSQDYPGDARRAGQEGTTRFRLLIGPNGRASHCQVERSSGSNSLDAATCRIMRGRARFTPALDGMRRPTSDSVAGAIAWRLPGLRRVADLRVALFTLAADGTPGECQQEVRVGRTIDRIKAAACFPALEPGRDLDPITLETSGRPSQILMASVLIRDPAAEWPKLEQPGRRIIARELGRLQIGQGGQVVGCSSSGYTGHLPPTWRACSGVGARLDGFDASTASEVRMISYTAILDGPPL